MAYDALPDVRALLTREQLKRGQSTSFLLNICMYIYIYAAKGEISG